MAIWTVAVEGDSDVPVAAAILAFYGHSMEHVYGLGGRGGIDKRLKAWCQAGRRSPWLILRDLDREACAPSLLATFPVPTSGIVRVAVREVEAWLLADREQAARWLGVPVGRIPRDVESIPDPKAALITLARGSRIRRIREDIVPLPHAVHGPGYVEQVRSYCAERWRPDVAAKSAPSLRRCIDFVVRRGKSVSWD